VALRIGIWQRDHDGHPIIAGELVHHSDAGSQYTALRFTEHLELEGIAPSIGRVADADDNGLMENVIGLFQTECLGTTVFHAGPSNTIADVEYATAGWVDWYNQRRLSLGWPCCCATLRRPGHGSGFATDLPGCGGRVMPVMRGDRGASVSGSAAVRGAVLDCSRRESDRGRGGRRVFPAGAVRPRRLGADDEVVCRRYRIVPALVRGHRPALARRGGAAGAVHRVASARRFADRFGRGPDRRAVAVRARCAAGARCPASQCRVDRGSRFRRARGGVREGAGGSVVGDLRTGRRA
jgi:Integrase core domain